MRRAFQLMMRPISFTLAALCFSAAQLLAAGSNIVVNLSHYDLMRPDFQTMAQQGVIGAIHESSYPRYVRDDKYFARQVAAVNAGLLWGAYHFADATDPTRQADFFLNTVAGAWRGAVAGGRPDDVLLVLDFEKNGHYPGGTMRVDQAVAFAERVRERTGVYPGLYSGEYRLRRLMSTATSAQRATLSQCWLWVANYHYQPGSLPPWDEWSLWQYTGDGKCDLRPRSAYPISVANIARAERNIFRGSATDLRAFWRKHGWSPGGRGEAPEP
jgi:lysozyme